MTAFQIQPVEIVKAFWRDKWIVVVTMIVSGGVSVAYALTRVPEFTSQAVLASPEEDNTALGALSGVLGQVSALTGGLGIPAFGGTSVEEVTAVMGSRDFSLRFIRNHELMPHLFPDKEWARAKSSTDGAASGEQTTLTGAALGLMNADGSSRLTVEDVLNRFDTMRTITVDRRTSFVTVKVRARHPVTAQRIAQAMIKDINEELRGRALAEARSAEAFLTEKIASAQFESIKNTAAALLESQLKREVIAESRQDFALRVIDPPSLPEMRSYPRRTRIVILGGMQGALVAGLIVLIRLRRRTPSPAK